MFSPNVFLSGHRPHGHKRYSGWFSKLSWTLRVTFDSCPLERRKALLRAPVFRIDDTTQNNLPTSNTMLFHEDQTTAVVLFVSSIGLALKAASWFRSRGAHLGKRGGKSFSRNFRPTKPLAKKDELIIQMLDEHEHDDADMTAMYVISDPTIQGHPIVYASKGFCQLTQYTKEELEGKNCRLLQGSDTDPKDVKKISDAIAAQTEVSVCLLNYKKNGKPFYNQFFMLPLRDDHGTVLYYLSVSKEIPSKEHTPELNLGWQIFSWQPRYTRFVI